MDEHVIAPRRSLPPVPPAPRSTPGTTLTPPAPADETSWYDPQDLLSDSLVHTDLLPDRGPLAEGTAAQAAHDLVRESGRMLVLDEQLLAALDAAAKAAEARRALTADLAPADLAPADLAPADLAPVALPTAMPTPTTSTPAPPTPAPSTPAALGPTTAVAPLPTLPPLPARAGTAADDVEDDEDDVDDDLQDDGAPEATDQDDDLVAGRALGIDPSTVDVAAEFARHDDLVEDMAGDMVETGRHAAVDDEPLTGATALVTDTGRHHLALTTGYELEDGSEDGDDGVPTLGTLTHRTVVTRGTGRRWIPVGVGAGVLSIVAAVLLTSGFGVDQGTTGTDEAARTGAATTEVATPTATTPTQPAPAMNTLDLSGGSVVTGSPRTDEDTATTARGTAAPRTGSAVQPQVATPPPAAQTSTATSAETPTSTTSSTATQTAETPSGSATGSGSGSTTSGTDTSGGSTSGGGTGSPTDGQG